MNVNNNSNSNDSNQTTTAAIATARTSLPTAAGTTATTIPQEEEYVGLDSLTDALVTVGDCFATMNQQMDNLNQANDSLQRLNRSFGAFLFAMTAHGSALQYSHVNNTAKKQMNDNNTINSSGNKF